MKFSERLRRLVEDTDTRAGRVFDLFIQGLVILSLISFSIESLPDLTPKKREILEAGEVIVVIIFSLEYLLRLFVTRKKLRFVFSFFGVIDILAILPFYLSFGVDLRSIRIVRLLRVFRILKLARYGVAVDRLRITFSIIREELVLFVVTSLILVYLAGVGIYVFEHEAQPELYKSVFEGLWWAIISLTSVGYGDIYPITPGGRIFTSVILLIGLGIIAVPAGLFASGLSRAREIEAEKNAEAK